LRSLGIGAFALMLNFVMQLTSNVNETIDTLSNHENRLVSVERCCYFTNVEPEIGYQNLKSLENDLRKGKSIQIDTSKLSWPSTGDIKISNLSIRYRNDLPLVINDLTLDVKQGTKIGIVGRTGAGKTTLISAIYRTFDEYGGNITISGKEIRQVDLKVLRNTMTIIP
jgi:ATP-binding cassette, subfamily C (CFTR/MRP), member 1